MSTQSTLSVYVRSMGKSLRSSQRWSDFVGEKLVFLSEIFRDIVRIELKRALRLYRLKCARTGSWLFGDSVSAWLGGEISEVSTALRWPQEASKYGSL